MKCDLLCIPIPGKPLCRQFDAGKASGSAKAGDDFFAGLENYLVAVAVCWALGSDIDINNDVVDLSFYDANSCMTYCPILLYGPPGCGKSHIALGIFQTWRQKNRRKRGACLTGDDFAKSLADAIESKTVDDFRGKIRQS